MNRRLLLGNVLVRQGAITEAQLSEALLYQRAHQMRLGEALLELSCCTELQLSRALAEQLGMRFVDLGAAPPSPGVLQLLPATLARRYGVVPVDVEGVRLLIAPGNPIDFHIDSIVRQATGRPVEVVYAPPAQIAVFLEHYGALASWSRQETDDQRVSHVRKLLQWEPGGPRVPSAPAPGDARNAPPPCPLPALNARLAERCTQGATELEFEIAEDELRVHAMVEGRRVHLGSLAPPRTRIRVRLPRRGLSTAGEPAPVALEPAA